MKIVVFGATGMVGQGALRECLRAPNVSEVIAVGRQAPDTAHAKLRTLVIDDLSHLGRYRSELQDVSGALFCIGATAAGLSEEAYRKVTFDLTLDVASQLAAINPAMVFVYTSGAGADSTERGPVMWARVRGKTENAILRLPFVRSYILRPALIQPLHGARSKTPSYRLLYRLMTPVFPLLRWLAPGNVLSTVLIGQAMLKLIRTGAPLRVLESADIRALIGSRQ